VIVLNLEYIRLYHVHCICVMPMTGLRYHLRTRDASTAIPWLIDVLVRCSRVRLLESSMMHIGTLISRSG
jgi:hypothetical protein